MMKNYILLDRNKIEEQIKKFEENYENNVPYAFSEKAKANNLKGLLNSLEDLKSLLQQAFEAGERNGREEGLYDFGHIANFECKEPDFEDWYNKQQEQ